jgi:hypothetical protein
MTKLLLGAASALFLFNTASFAAEKTVTLAVENMTLHGLPTYREGESRGSSRRQPCGDLFRGQDRQGHL